MSISTLSVCYASQSSSSSAVGCCGAGRGGITSDILANAPPELAGASDESPPAGPLPEIPVKYPPWKIHQEGWKHWDWGAKTKVSNAPFLRMANLLKRSDIRFPPLTAAPTEQKDNIDYAKGNINLFFNDFYTLHGFRRMYTLCGCIFFGCKDIILLNNYFFKWNQRILKEMHQGFYKNIEQHNCFQHWQW